MNFVTQLGLLAIILMILVILIKSNQTLEQIYMEGENPKETIDVKPFKMPQFNFSFLKEKTTQVKENKMKKDRKVSEENKEKHEKSEKTVARSFSTIPMEKASGWYLETIDYSGRSFGRIPITSFPFTIGRATDNDYVLDDLSVSSHHASIEKEDGQLEIVDLGSLNKIMVGGSPVMRAPLVDHMEISLGNTLLRFCKEERSAAHTIAYQKNSMMEEWY